MCIRDRRIAAFGKAVGGRVGHWLCEIFSGVVVMLVFAGFTWQFARRAMTLTATREETPLLAWHIGPWWWAATALLALGLPFIVTAATQWQLTLVLLVFGVVFGTVDISVNAYAVAMEARLDRPMMSTLHGLFSLGGLIGAGSVCEISRSRDSNCDGHSALGRMLDFDGASVCLDDLVCAKELFR